MRVVNYYERNLGDYYRDAQHLSMLQHGAYTLLMDRYYITESGIPDALKYDITRAKTAAERRAVDKVLVQFFRLSQTGFWIKNRCEEEITKARKRIEAARENGSKGGRPRNPETTHGVSGEKPNPLNQLTQSKALQSPGSISQTPDLRFKTPSEAAPSSAPAAEADATAVGRGGVVENKKPPLKSPRNRDWDGVIEHVRKSLSILPDQAHPDCKLLAKVSGLTEAQCIEAVKQLRDRGQLPKVNGNA